MKKCELMKRYEEVKDNVENIVLFIHMPTEETEVISNPNVVEKIAYINKTYNNDLIHNNCKDIYIEDVHFCLFEDTFDFGDAIHYLKDGMKVARKGWSEKNQYIELATNISYEKADGKLEFCVHEIGNKAIAFVSTSGIQIGWQPNQTDTLATDWVIVE